MTPTLAYFGERWDSPMFDDVETIRVDTPAGKPCMWCEEPIADGDRGLLRSVVCDVQGEWRGVLEPIHAECDLRMGLGSVAHLTGRCSCTGATETPYPGTRREEALAVLAIIDDQRAAHRLPPI